MPLGAVRLRGIELEDLPLLKKWRNELRHFFREYRLITDAHQLKWYNSIQDDKRFIHYAIDVWDGEDWCLIGSCNWSNIDWVNRHAEVGRYIGDPEYRGKGYGLKMTIELHRIVFQDLNMNTVRGEMWAYNTHNIDFLSKFGYKVVGRYRNAMFYQGRFWDSVLVDMTSEEWDVLWNDKYSKYGDDAYA